ncbi:PREDICTED: uncharacterized protein LOC108580232 [Habropoda laboriosa]|uniref:uncharacterized protein LOC108580232 n=1 Tax=Habropoda laboriosa TaxID=597456 RepID=UPI00083E55AE|nr:PREDICTED: uncharacterized protein LOC108580232 [Habropoda laboriosa]
MKKFFFFLLCIFSTVILVLGVAEENDGVLGKIKAGLEYATNYLEAAKDIADLVAKSLGHKQKDRRGENFEKKEKGSFGPSNVMSAFFRLIGLDSQKVTAIAVNSVIFLAQMISSLFELKPPKENIARNLDDEIDSSSWDPAKLIMESKNEKVSHSESEKKKRT